MELKLNNEVYLFEYDESKSDGDDYICGEPSTTKVCECDVYRCENLSYWVRLVKQDKSWMLKHDLLLRHFGNLKNIQYDSNAEEIAKAINLSLNGQNIFEDLGGLLNKKVTQ